MSVQKEMNWSNPVTGFLRAISKTPSLFPDCSVQTSVACSVKLWWGRGDEQAATTSLIPVYLDAECQDLQDTRH